VRQEGLLPLGDDLVRGRLDVGDGPSSRLSQTTAPPGPTCPPPTTVPLMLTPGTK